MSITRRVINRARQKQRSREALAVARSKKGEEVGGKSARLLKAWKTRFQKYGKSGSRRKAREPLLKKSVRFARRVVSGDTRKLPYKEIRSKQSYGTSSQRRYKPGSQGRSGRRTGGGYARGRKNYRAGVSRYR